MTTVSDQKMMLGASMGNYCERIALVSDMIRAGDMTRADLRRLIERNPARYAMFRGILENDSNWENECP